MMKPFMFLLIALFCFACAGKPTPIPDIDSAEAKLFAKKCGECHSVPHPMRHTASQWEHMISVMEKQMEHEKMHPLTKDEKETILGYLKKHSR